MPKTIKTKYRSNELKYSHAYDEHNNYVSLEDAVKLSKRNWYLYRDRQIELIDYFDNKKQQDHWRAKADQSIIVNGKKFNYSPNKDSESYEHKSFKGKIIENGYFWFKGLKILISNAKEEVRIVDGKYRADILANLEDAEICIEIIRTSDLSETKESDLKTKQILTFKIYIDENGNQKHKRDYVIGNTDLEQTYKRIQGAEGAIAEQRELLEGVDRVRKEEGKRELQLYKGDFARRIADINDQIKSFNIENGAYNDRRESLEKSISEIRERIRGLSNRIQSIKQSIRHYQDSERADVIPEYYRD
jgi:methyl-accepting chemotaxis protein